MSIRLALVGASGKMGQMIMQQIKQDPDFTLYSTLCSPHSKKLGQQSYEKLTYQPVCDSNIDVVIDFSSKEGTLVAADLQKPLICGTTGLTEKEWGVLQKLSQKIPVLYSPNFSLGISLCFQLFQNLASKVKNFKEILLTETHHQDKKDRPSGTALHIAKILEIPRKNIVSVRENKTTFHHQVEFFLNNEKIHIQHEAFSREAFALGALTAAKFIFNRPAGFYNLQDIWS